MICFSSRQLTYYLIGAWINMGLGFIFVMFQEVVLLNGTEQFERFELVPFPLSLNVRFFNISNPDDVLEGGVPIVNEIGPYVYQ